MTPNGIPLPSSHHQHQKQNRIRQIIFLSPSPRPDQPCYYRLTGFVVSAVGGHGLIPWPVHEGIKLYEVPKVSDYVMAHIFSMRRGEFGCRQIVIPMFATRFAVSDYVDKSFCGFHLTHLIPSLSPISRTAAMRCSAVTCSCTSARNLSISPASFS